jgi:hypothetical protein
MPTQTIAVSTFQDVCCSLQVLLPLTVISVRQRASLGGDDFVELRDESTEERNGGEEGDDTEYLVGVVEIVNVELCTFRPGAKEKQQTPMVL